MRDGQNDFITGSSSAAAERKVYIIPGSYVATDADRRYQPPTGNILRELLSQRRVPLSWKRKAASLTSIPSIIKRSACKGG